MMSRSFSSLSTLGLLLAVAVMALSGCSKSESSGNAQIRLLNVSPYYDSLDLYTVQDSGSDVSRFSAVGYQAVSGFSSLESGTYAVKIKRAGITSALATVSGQQLTDDSHTAYIAYGSLGRFGVLSLGEDQDAADAGKVKLTIHNVAEAGVLDVYLTDTEVSLDDVSPVLTGLGSGGQSSVLTLDSGDYRLRITGTGDADDVRFDLDTLTLGSGAVTSLVLTATQGGVLVNALMLPQQGDALVYRNTMARVRAANGVSSGTALTVRMGGRGLFANATLGAIGSTYTQVAAGTVGVDVAVDGTVLDVADQTLQAGGDYTLLVWNDASEVRTTLVEDDNRLPLSSGKAKIRTLNGLSGLARPVTLSLNYAPIAEGVELGAVSAYVEADGGSDNQLDVTDALTGANVLTRSSISLQSAAVYTLFLAGETGMISGTLRKDR